MVKSELRCDNCDTLLLLVQSSHSSENISNVKLRYLSLTWNWVPILFELLIKLHWLYTIYRQETSDNIKFSPVFETLTGNAWTTFRRKSHERDEKIETLICIFYRAERESKRPSFWIGQEVQSHPGNVSTTWINEGITLLFSLQISVDVDMNSARNGNSRE